MKSIQDYIKEGLLSKKNISKIDNEEGIDISKHHSSVTFEWPLKEDCLEWRKITIKNPKKFVIYYDKYRRGLHVSTFGGMLETYLATDTFEDFTPEDIKEDFYTLKDACEYALKDYKRNKYCDHIQFLEDVVNGEFNESVYSDPGELYNFKTPTKKEIATVVNYWGDVKYPI